MVQKRFQYLASLLLLLVGLLPACQGSSNPSSAIKREHYFSVNVDKKIIFSSGNLQHQPSTGSWRFADNQWDIFIPDNSNDSIGQWVGHFANDTSMLNNSVGDGWRLLTQDEWARVSSLCPQSSSSSERFGFIRNGLYFKDFFSSSPVASTTVRMDLSLSFSRISQ